MQIINNKTVDIIMLRNMLTAVFANKKFESSDEASDEVESWVSFYVEKPAADAAGIRLNDPGTDIDAIIDNADDMRDAIQDVVDNIGMSFQIQSTNWNEEMEYFECTLSNGRTIFVQIQDADMGVYYPVHYEFDNRGITNQERAHIKELIKNEPDILLKCLEFDTSD